MRTKSCKYQGFNPIRRYDRQRPLVCDGLATRGAAFLNQISVATVMGSFVGSDGPATFGRPVGQVDHRQLDPATVDFVRGLLREEILDASTRSARKVATIKDLAGKGDGRRLIRQFRPEAFEEQRQLGLGPSAAGHSRPSMVGTGTSKSERRRISRCGCMGSRPAPAPSAGGPMVTRRQSVRQGRDVGFDSPALLTVDRPEGEVALQGSKLSSIGSA